MSTDTIPSPSAILEVPGEPGVYFCARHKSVKVRLRCGRCEAPICARCTVMTPVGARCKDCGTNRSSHIFQLSLVQVLVALGTSLALGALGAFLIDSLPFIGLFTIFYASAVGTLAGKVIVRATGGKRGIKLAVVAVAGLVLGALLLTLGEGGGLLGLADVWLWLFIGLSAAGAWYWIR